ncbi:hypothetical protein AX15_002183 [Amanita polypyramis BW_CC]|nr:hypothetical protein AX15_002183 [Amanita polypyramis BW_CC]
MSSLKEKDLLPLGSTPAPSEPRGKRLRKALITLALVGYTLKLLFSAASISFPSSDSGGTTNYCPQTDVLVPTKNNEIWSRFTETASSDAYKMKVIDWLAGAVKVQTESFDDLGPVGSDPRWEVFSEFHEYLSTAYPQVHGALELTKVNTYGLLYVWKGQDPSLKPILLAAHQDVVPVDPSTWGSWGYLPFSGHFDGEKIWGRGSSDDKSGLIGILSVVEYLIEHQFKPTRTVVLAFGFDEEVNGLQGAATLAEALKARFGKDGFAFVVDEGAGFAQKYGSVFATPGIAEKGYYDVKIEVATRGGHSSVPPPHTSIGILSSLLVHYEAQPFKVPFKREDPLYDTVLCYGQHAKSMSKDLRRLIQKSTGSDKALRLLERELYEDRVLKSQVGTTQAIDIIHGGVKSNALPEKAHAIVNHRISMLSSVAAVQKYDAKRLKKLASHHNLTFNAFGKSIGDESAPSSGSLTLSDALAPGLEPAPITPSNAAPFELLSGTIKATYNSHRALQGPNNVYVAPGMMTGNTDTRYYWDLSKHIFRYNHQNAGNSSNTVVNNIHTVNESIPIDTVVEMTRFFATLILNADESTSL